MSNPQKPYDAGDQHQVETKAKRIKLADRAADEDFRTMMDVPGFRAFVWRLLERAHIHETSFQTDALGMAFREGERNIGLSLMADVMRLTPHQYQTMAAEAAKRKEMIDG